MQIPITGPTAGIKKKTMGLGSEIPCGSHPHRATVQFTATHWSPNSEKTSLLLFTLTPGMLSLTLWASSHPPAMHSCLPTLCCLLSLHSWTCQHKAKGTAFFPLLQSLSGNCHDFLLALSCLSLPNSNQTVFSKLARWLDRQICQI